MNMLATAFRTHCDQVLLVAAAATQRQETRRAFYSGAHTMLTLLNAIADLSTADREQAMHSLKTELATFAATVGTELEGKV